MNKMINIIKKNYKLILGASIIIIAIISLAIKRGTYSTSTNLDEITISCQDEIKYKESFICQISLNTSLLNYKGISFNYNNDDAVEVKNIIPTSEWDFIINEENGAVLINLENENEVTEIGNIEFFINDNSKSNYQIGFTNITIGDGEAAEAKLEDVNLEISVIQEEINYEIIFDDLLIVDRDNKYIKFLTVDTKVSELFSKVNVEEGNIVIYDKDGNIKNDNDNIATGDILKSYFHEELKDEYKLSVIGDANGDGKFNTTDLYLWRQQYVKNINLTDVHEIALDFDSNGVINTTDLFNIRRAMVDGYVYVLEQIRSLQEK